MRVLQALDLYTIPYNKMGACAGIAITAAYYNANGRLQDFLNVIDLLHHDIRINGENILVSSEVLAMDMGYDLDVFKALHKQALEDPDIESNAEFLEVVAKLEDKYLIEALNAVEHKALTTDELSELERMLLSVKPILEMIAIHQDQQNIDKVDQDILTNLSYGSMTKSIHVQSKSIKILNRESMKSHLESLLSEAGSSVNISNIDHRINISYDGSHYYLVDHDEVIVKESINDLLGYIGLAMMPNDSKEIIVNSELITNSKPINGVETQFDEPSVKKISNTAGESNLLKLALKYGYDQAVSAYLETLRMTDMPLEEKFELCYAQFSGKFSGVATAMIKGQPATVKAYFDQINQFDFSDEQFEQIYRGKADNSDYCVLRSMIYLNQQDMIKLYVESLINSPLALSSKLALLSPYDSVEMGLLVGNYKAVDVFIDAIRNIELDKRSESLMSLYSIYKEISAKLDSSNFDSNQFEGRLINYQGQEKYVSRGIARLWEQLTNCDGKFKVPDDAITTLDEIKSIIRVEANPKGVRSVTNLFFGSSVSDNYFQHIERTL
ncbi:hypothetical protein L3V82_08075 [Thiotrichales bacterium 19S3-7]|nr:hypothetical protein [Thiotrichales bacterium 19S3-7]MCF6802117.1 hypothetical protein [Thiotrichales bacterium 19S3-11]